MGQVLRQIQSRTHSGGCRIPGWGLGDGERQALTGGDGGRQHGTFPGRGAILAAVKVKEEVSGKWERCSGRENSMDRGTRRETAREGQYVWGMAGGQSGRRQS